MPASTGVGTGIPDPVARLVADALSDIKIMADKNEPSHAVFLEAIRNQRADEDTGLVMQKVDLVAAETNARLHKAPAPNETKPLGKPSSESMIEHPPDSSFSTYEAARARMHISDLRSVWWRALRADEVSTETGHPRLANGALLPPNTDEQTVADAVKYGNRSDPPRLLSERIRSLHQ